MNCGTLRPSPRGTTNGRRPLPPAAYRLLHHSFTVRLWHLLAWDCPRWEGTEAGVPVTLAEMEESLHVLAENIPANLYTEMKAALAHCGKLADDGAGGQLGLAPGKALWQQLRSLADRALRKDTTLQGWANLGAAVGEAELRLYAEAGADVVDVLQPILVAIKGLPAGAIAVCPTLARLSSVPGGKDAVKLVKLMQKAVGAVDEWPDEENEAAIRHLAAVTVGGVNAAIEDALKTIPGVEVVAPVIEDDAAPELHPGHLSLILVTDRHEVRRVGYRQPVSFGGKVILWQLLETLWRRREGFYPKEELIRAVWPDVIVSESTFWGAINDVRELLQSLNVTITYTKMLGYRLEESGLEGRGW